MKYAGWFGFGAFVASMVWLLEACTTLQAKQAAAESGYTAELIACVDQSQTLAESKRCRAEVDRRWRVTDGGEQ